ncbi:MAG: response regulator [Cyanobacteriota bacterium]
MDKKFITTIICDDEIQMREYLKEIVTEMGYEVIAEANNGEEVIQLYNEKKPDLLFLAVNIPYKNGFEVLEEIIKLHPQAFIIIVSSLADIETITRCIDIGAYNYIRKDTSREKIKSIIKETRDYYLREKL